MRFFLAMSFTVLFMAWPALAGEIVTNNIKMPSPPAWVTQGSVEKVTEKIQSLLEWDIHRVTVLFYSSAESFQQAGAASPQIEAFFRHSDQTVHLGPLVTAQNFDAIFGHELVHVIVHQKYHEAIPGWLEEGLANYLAQKGKVDYAWLKAQPTRDVTTLSHPFTGDADPRYDYAASQAVAELLATRCSLPDLLRLSVGKKLETYLDTFCEIKDINAEFRDWVNRRARGIAATH